MASPRSRIAWSLVLATVAIGVGILVAESGVAPLPVVSDAQLGPIPGTRVRVQVLNAGGIAGLARDATEYLRDFGFDVVDFGNAGDFDADTSVVLDRVGRDETARAVADVLGINNVRSQPDSNLYVDVSVLLGSEWRRPDLPEAELLEQPAWWNLRGWLRR
jgi:hypothetical protein